VSATRSRGRNPGRESHPRKQIEKGTYRDPVAGGLVQTVEELVEGLLGVPIRAGALWQFEGFDCAAELCR
jgi:hypothetical protein